jgi:hypothetical protein
LPAPHPPASRLRRLNVAPVARADLRRSADPAAPHRATSAAPAGPAVRHPATSTDPAGPAVPLRATSAGRAVHRPVTSAADPTTTTGDHRGTQGTTTGADGSTVPRGVMICRPGAGVRRRRLRGMDRCQRHGVRLRRQSTTGAFRSSRYGIPVTTNGASGSSGSGFRSRSDPTPGRPPRVRWGGRPPGSIHLSEWRIGRCLSPPTKIVAMCWGSPVSSIDSSRGTSSEKKLLTSIRASAAPRQKCTP